MSQVPWSPSGRWFLRRTVWFAQVFFQALLELVTTNLESRGDAHRARGTAIVQATGVPPAARLGRFILLYNANMGAAESKADEGIEFCAAHRSPDAASRARSRSRRSAFAVRDDPRPIHCVSPASVKSLRRQSDHSAGGASGLCARRSSFHRVRGKSGSPKARSDLWRPSIKRDAI